MNEVLIAAFEEAIKEYEWKYEMWRGCDMHEEEKYRKCIEDLESALMEEILLADEEET